MSLLSIAASDPHHLFLSDLKVLLSISTSNHPFLLFPSPEACSCAACLQPSWGRKAERSHVSWGTARREARFFFSVGWSWPNPSPYPVTLTQREAEAGSISFLGSCGQAVKSELRESLLSHCAAQAAGGSSQALLEGLLLNECPPSASFLLTSSRLMSRLKYLPSASFFCRV